MTDFRPKRENARRVTINSKISSTTVTNAMWTGKTANEEECLRPHPLTVGHYAFKAESDVFTEAPPPDVPKKR
jgi:hypothetical protein